MTPAGAEILLIGILAGFFVSRVVQQLVARRPRALDEETYEQLERAVEAALARRLAEGGIVAAAPAEAADASASPAALADPATATETPTEEAPTTTEAPPDADAPADGVPTGEPVTMKVTTVAGETHELQIQSGENMLTAALDRDVDLDYSCQDGGCDTCTVKVLQGMENISPVRDEERDMLDDDEIEEGHRLSCIITVHGPIELIQEER